MTAVPPPADQPFGDLTLWRQTPDIDLETFKKLDHAGQLRCIQQAQGKQRYELIMQARAPERLVGRLHPQDLYLTMTELAPESALELLGLATTAQITTLLDLDCWDGDTLSEAISLRWLELLLATGEDKVRALARQMEPEILALFLKKHLTITRGLEAYDDDTGENTRQLGSLYDIDYQSEDAAKVIGALLNIWSAQEQQSYLLIMEMIRSEQLSVLEEEVYQARHNRLLDLGLPPTSEARAIYSYRDPDSFRPGGKQDFRLEAEAMPYPAALLARAQPGRLLAEVIAAAIDPQSACELLMLANRKMSADSVDLSSAKAVTATVRATYDTLNLALEYLAGDDPEKAEHIFRSTYLLELFQLGHSLVTRARRRGRALAESPLGPLLDYPSVLLLEALEEQPPALYLHHSTERPGELRPISTRHDLQLLEAHLNELEALETLFCHRFPFPLPDPDAEAPELPTLSRLFMTAVANRFLGGAFVPTPLSGDQLKQLKEQSLQQQEIHPALLNQMHELLAQEDTDCRTFLNFCRELWEDFFRAEHFTSDIQPDFGFLVKS